MKSKLRHDLAQFLGHHKQIVHNVLGLAVKLFTQLFILGGNSYRAGIQMTLAHHDAAQGNQRGCGKSKFFST